MRPYWYILAGVALLVGLIYAGRAFSLFPSGIFNSAQVLSIIVLNPDGTPGGGGTTGGTSGSGGSTSSGGGGGGGGGSIVTTAAATPPVLPKTVCAQAKQGDINCDGKVNITDFSILAYWFKRALTAQAIAAGVDLNNDGKVTLADFSILAFYWNK